MSTAEQVDRSQIRVGVLAAHPVVRVGLKQMLSSESRRDHHPRGCVRG